MEEATHALLIEVAVFLTLYRDGLILPEQAKREAAALIDKIGRHLEAEDQPT